ncbi:DHA2 family efflux MFS transporter permease subunit [Terriglobus albidus]|uniref:DHA2 family efflux MFS transporter permease subunit n=1 Tax=Terriglobus albidus TaxID=1592106 RepID=A0A5B9E2Y1_9BACT|nr:DHA2 family efflux MFS transporter permease subunit [Terriglobus albidus]QEE26663.1 DHA2 family efflux MFS transporter permease subunit [Terriglobus albidus]
MTTTHQLATHPKTGPAVWKIVVVAVIGSLLSQLDSTIVNVSLSSLAHDLGTTLSAIQWVTSGYLLALALMLPLNAWLVNRLGTRRLYLVSFTCFVATSALCGFAWSPASLIAFRVLQGMCGGLLAPLAQMMIARAAGRDMARIMGYATAPILLGPILGPVIAGLILQHAGWRWLFFVNVPVGALGVVLAVLFLPKDETDLRSTAFDLQGFLLLAPALVLFLYSTDHIRETAGIALMIIAVVFLVCFVRSALRKGDEAILDLQLFRGRTFRTATTIQFLSNGISFAGQMLVPFFLMRACGKSPSATGLMLTPMGLGMLCSYPMMGTLTQRFGIRRVSFAGALLSLAATLPFLYLSLHGLVTSMLAVTLFLRGVGMGAIGIPSISAAYAAVPWEQLPMATTTLNIVQRLGGPTLTTLLATFVAWRMASASSIVFPAAFALLSAFHIAQAVATSRLPRELPGGKAVS